MGVLGHSEGGTIALMLASDQKTDFIISLAGMVISGAETLVWQNRLALLEAGIPEATVETYCRLLSEAFDKQINGGSFPSADLYDLPDVLKQNYQAVLAQIRTPYMSHLLTLDMRQILPGINCPVMALNGTKDLQVEAGSNLEALRKGLPANDKNHIEPIDGVNHLFQHCTTGSVSEYRTIEETFAPEVLEKITVWLSQLSY